MSTLFFIISTLFFPYFDAIVRYFDAILRYFDAIFRDFDIIFRYIDAILHYLLFGDRNYLQKNVPITDHVMQLCEDEAVWRHSQQTKFQGLPELQSKTIHHNGQKQKKDNEEQ